MFTMRIFPSNFENSGCCNDSHKIQRVVNRMGYARILFNSLLATRRLLWQEVNMGAVIALLLFKDSVITYKMGWKNH